MVGAEVAPCFRAVCRAFRAAARARTGEQVSPGSLVRSAGPSVAAWAWAQPAFRAASGDGVIHACVHRARAPHLLECVLAHRDDNVAYDRDLWKRAGDAGHAHVLQWLLDRAARLLPGDVTRLDFNDCGTRDEDMPHLASALRADTTLTEVDFSHNGITDEGAQHLADALATNATLTDISVLGNDLTEEGVRALVAAAESKPNQIKSLRGIAEDAVSVDFSARDLGPADAVLLAFDIRVKFNATVTVLILSRNYIGPVCAQHIAEALKVNAMVTKLNLGANQIGPVGAQHIAEATKVNATVTHLNLSGNDIGAVGAQHIAEALAVNTTVTQLDLSHNNQIGAVGAQHITALKVNATVTKLSLYYNHIGDISAQHLAAALKVNATVTELDLSYNWFADSSKDLLQKAWRHEAGLRL
ncbi:hypothetical protein T492DRAFT_584373 [Pavlovales sp. CCMP2436]|nr:hypothetical protein T492DRAFT_584373 [Pavlovales sp. CCMP2436]